MFTFNAPYHFTPVFQCVIPSDTVEGVYELVNIVVCISDKQVDNPSDFEVSCVDFFEIYTRKFSRIGRREQHFFEFPFVRNKDHSTETFAGFEILNIVRINIVGKI